MDKNRGKKRYKCKNASWVHIYTTLKRIELESPSCSGFEIEGLIATYTDWGFSCSGFPVILVGSPLAKVSSQSIPESIQHMNVALLRTVFAISNNY